MVIIIDTHFLKCYYGLEDVEYERNDIFKTTKGEGANCMPEFIGNIGTHKLHSVRFADGRCKLDIMKPENKVEFDTLEEGLNYPSTDRKALIPCAVCIPKYQSFILERKDMK